MAPYMNPGSSGADDNSSSSRLSRNSMDGNEIGPDIAIIGLSFQFPEAETEESLWELMNSGRSAATEFPPDRLSSSRYYDLEDSRTGTIRSQKASFLKRDISCFDPKMFGFTPDEASGTDPQQRILLETTYKALENAGISMQKISGSATSVHVGCFTADYTLCVAKDPEKIPRYTATGVAASMLSNRISLFYNLSGPSLTVDTACSSSLVALDLACRSLRQGESTMGIVAGSNLLFVPDYFMSLSNLGFLSPDGVCHSFDNRANGYGRGEGFGVLIIKPLEAAVRDGDTIRAVIRATAANQNGRTSLAQPSKEMQMQLIQETYRKAGLDMSLTRYFEAHGTGTAVGDPLEAMAIGNSFRSSRDPNDPIVIGALKASIGHLEGAAGIAGVIKTVLVLERGLIPPIADLKELNTSIDAEFLKLKFPRTPTPWPREGLRRASVNSFGFGGTNAHAILDDAFHYLKNRGIVANHCTSVATPEHVTNRIKNYLNHSIKAKSLATRSRLFVWSAHEKHTATKMLEIYREHLERLAASEVESRNDKYLEALAYTLTQRRSLHGWKVFEVADSVSQLVERLLAPKAPVQPRSDPRVGFVFTGQGAQWAGMGKELFVFPVFQNSILAADKFLRSIGCEWKATDILLNSDKTGARINEPRFAQSLCTILQVAIVELLRSFHIYPRTAVGHSSGEIAAAYAVGAISRQSAWKLAYFRGLFSSELAESIDTTACGAMMAVGLSESSARSYVDETIRSFPDGGVLAVACVNSPKNITLSGDKLLIEEQRVILEREGIFARVLKVPVAYHSPHMLRIAASYLASIGILEPGESPPVFANMVSSVTGDIITKCELTKAEYWVRNMVSPVRFSDAIGRLCRDSSQKVKKKLDLSHRKFASVSDLLEIGPHSALQGPIRETIEVVSPSTRNGLSYTSALIRGRPATDTLLEAAGKLHCLGFDVNLESVNGSLSTSDSAVVTLPDLPEYPFDQSHTYWDESSISRNVRIHSQPFNEFLGLPVQDWNPLEPRWRNTLKVSLMPWLEDHKINGEILFPGAGMMVMAIEAMIQIADGQNITGFELRDTAILSALTIPPDDSGVDTLFCLKPSLDSSKKASSWATFSLYSCRKDNFIEVSRGSIKAIYDSQSYSEFAGQDVKHTRDWISAANSSYGSEINTAELYGKLEANGYQYGPSFQGIESARRSSSGQALGLVSTRGFPPMGNVSSRAPSVIHPCTLDSILQLCLPGVVRVNNDQMATYVPTYIAKGWVSNSVFDAPEKNSHLYVHASSKNRSVRLCEANIHVVGQKSGGLLLQTEGIELTLINDEMQFQGHKTSQSHVRRLCFDMIHKPDPTLLSSKQLSEYARKSNEVKTDPTEFLRTLKLHILVSIFRAANTVEESEIPTGQPHLLKQYAWMKTAIDAAKQQPPPGIPSLWQEFVDDSRFEELCDRLRGTGRLGEIYVYFGSYLVEMLRGKIDSLQVLVPDGRLKDFYEYSNNLGQLFGPLHQYIDSLAHKNPGMKILEVGAGTGGMTRRLLDTLAVKAPNGIYTRFSQYDFTDISASFLESAADEFDSYPKMNYRLLNVEEDPANQGYEYQCYDLIVTANVLHVTKSLQQTLSNLRKLLKELDHNSDGKLVFIEITQPTASPTQSVFGFLPGWWLGTETWRQNGPCATISQWDHELKATGFAGTEMIFDDFELEENKVMSLLVSSAASASINGTEGNAGTKNKTALVVTGWNAPSCSSLLADLTTSKLGEIGISDTGMSSFSETASQEDLGERLIIVIHEGSWLSLADLDAEMYSIFKATLTRASKILWIFDKTPTFVTKEVSPGGPVQGLSRALRSEMPGLIFATVALDFSSSPAVLSSLIEKSLGNFLQGVNSGTYERELVQANDLLCIPRVYEDGAINQMIHDFTSDSLERRQRFGEQNVKLKVKRPGLLDTIYFEEVPKSGPLSPNELEIEVKSVGVNFRDCLIALGRVDQDTLGTECAGVVRNAGSACRLKPGDGVAVCALDTFHGLFRCDERLAVKMPDDMTFADAGALSINFVTAYHALIRIARLARGESVLIHSGAGGTGQAAIQVAQSCGAEIYTTVGSSTKKELLTSLYGIPPKRILNSRDLSFVGDIKRLTNNKGVDVVLNALSGDALVASWECVAPYGRFLEIGKRDIFSHNTLPMFQFARNVSFSAIDIAAIIQERPDIIQDTLCSVIELFQSKVLRMPSPMKSFPISEVEAAFRYLQNGTNAGKVVVEVNPEDIIPAVIAPKSDWMFSPEETFIIAGGLGAQGRSIAQWMVSKGARNLVLLSRGDISGSSEISSFVHELQSSGATVHCPSCDIGDAEALGAVLDYCKTHFPPIKGCIQAAMDLKDSIFENIDYEGWSASLRPKVQGSWNLHKQLPSDLDFFILFSSIAGVLGSQGQSNYAAGNTYQDELARYRLSMGEKAISLNFPMLANYGFAVDYKEAARRFVHSRYVMEMWQPEVLALLEYYCDKRLPLDPTTSQIVMGLELPDDIISRGIDPVGWMQEPMFSNLHQMGSSNAADSSNSSGRTKGPDLIKQLEGAASLPEAADIVANGIATKVCRVLSLSQDAFDVAQPLHTYGVDSLIAVEMRNWFIQILKVDVAVFEILGGATAGTLGRTVAEKLRAGS